MATMKDLANYTGLSLGTISKYLNGGTVKESNKAIIDEGIKAINFTVNEFARGLRTNKSRTVGVIIPSLNNVFAHSVISYVEDILSANSYSTIICDYREDHRVESEKLDFLCNKLVDGIIIMPSGNEAGLREKLNYIMEQRSIPVVMLDRVISGLECDAVLSDNTEMMFKVTKELIARGHERIGIILGEKSIYTTRKRLEGYLMAHKDYKKPVNEEYMQYGDYYVESGYNCCTKLLEMENPPTALIVTNYDMTSGALMAIKEKNVDIPGDISVIGYDNKDIARFFKPQISMVTQPVDVMGKVAANLMLQRLRSNDDETNKISIHKSTFVLTDSVADLNKK